MILCVGGTFDHKRGRASTIATRIFRGIEKASEDNLSEGYEAGRVHLSIREDTLLFGFDHISEFFEVVDVSTGFLIIKISGIKDYLFADTPTLRNSERSGRLTRIRPADSEKTYLGIYIGEIARSCCANVENDAVTLRQRDYVPAIFVPDLNKTLLGTESCWSFVDEPKARPITDQEIEDRWYVRKLGNRGNNTLRVSTGEGNEDDI